MLFDSLVYETVSVGKKMELITAGKILKRYTISIFKATQYDDINFSYKFCNK